MPSPSSLPFDDIVYALSQKDRERHLCAMTATRAQQGGLMALIAFNDELARIAHTVSEPMLGKIKLQWWIDVVPGILQGRPPSHPVAQALAEVRDVLAARSKELRHLAEARNFELEPDKPTSVAELYAYAEATGGALQTLMLDLLGISDGETHQAAREVGTAWALIGTMRALPYPTPARRDMLAQNATVKDVLEHAETLIKTARARTTSKGALPALVIARLADRHIKRLARQGWDPARREEPPAGFGAVGAVWLGKVTKRF